MIHHCTACGTALEWADIGAEPALCPVCGGRTTLGIQDSMLAPPTPAGQPCPVCGHEIPAGRNRCVYCMSGLPGSEQMFDTSLAWDARDHHDRYSPEKTPKVKESWIVAGIIIAILIGIYFIAKPNLGFKSQKTQVEEAVRDGLKDKLGSFPEQLTLNDQGGGRFKGTAIVNGKTLDVTASLRKTSLWFEYQERITTARMEEFVADSIRKQAGQAPTKVTLTDQGGGKYSGTAELGGEKLLVSATVEGPNLSCEWRSADPNPAQPPRQIVIPNWQPGPGNIPGLNWPPGPGNVPGLNWPPGPGNILGPKGPNFPGGPARGPGGFPPLGKPGQIVVPRPWP